MTRQVWLADQKAMKKMGFYVAFVLALRTETGVALMICASAV